MSEATKPTLAQILDAPLKKTGMDVPEGSYAGTLFEFGEPFTVKNDKFAKPGQPTERTVFEARFGLFVKGQLQAVDYLVPVPNGGAANQKSNVYKMLKALKGTDPKFFASDGSGNFAEGVKLGSFIGANGTVQVKKNAKDFPTVDGVMAPMDGVKYPTLEECKVLIGAGDSDIPF